MNNNQVLSLNTTGGAQARPIEMSAPGMVEVRVGDASEVDNALAEAIAVVTLAATHHRIGVMVTRMGAGVYMVRAHPEVPFGLIRQRHTSL